MAEELEMKSSLDGAEVIVDASALGEGEIRYTASPVDGAADAKEERADTCPTCNGSGEVDDETCPECGGSGELAAASVTGQQNTASPELEQRKAQAELLDGTPETRDFSAEMELREASNGKLRLTGYASTTETPYEVNDFTETIARGAFKRTLADEPDVVLLVNHEGIPLARTRSGTMTLSEDVRGLRVDAELDASNPRVQELQSPMERGDLTEMSFAFRATQQTWDESYTERTIREVTIHRGDVSMVTHGANSSTSGDLSIRSAETPDQAPKRPQVTDSYVERAKAKRARHRRLQ